MWIARYCAGIRGIADRRFALSAMTAVYLTAMGLTLPFAYNHYILFILRFYVPFFSPYNMIFVYLCDKFSSIKMIEG
jgi:hypothetical protein